MMFLQGAISCTKLFEKRFRNLLWRPSRGAKLIVSFTADMLVATSRRRDSLMQMF